MLSYGNEIMITMKNKNRIIRCCRVNGKDDGIMNSTSFEKIEECKEITFLYRNFNHSNKIGNPKIRGIKVPFKSTD